MSTIIRFQYERGLWNRERKKRENRNPILAKIAIFWLKEYYLIYELYFHYEHYLYIRSISWFNRVVIVSVVIQSGGDCIGRYFDFVSWLLTSTINKGFSVVLVYAEIPLKTTNRSGFLKIAVLIFWNAFIQRWFGWFCITSFTTNRSTFFASAVWISRKYFIYCGFRRFRCMFLNTSQSTFFDTNDFGCFWAFLHWAERVLI